MPDAFDAVKQMVNIYNSATITIGEKAAVYATRSAMLLARVQQSGGIFKLSDFNAINVKVSRASVDVLGKVLGGYNSKDKGVDIGKRHHLRAGRNGDGLHLHRRAW